MPNVKTASQREPRELDRTEPRWREIGISALAAALKYQGDSRNPAAQPHVRPGAARADRE